MGELVGKPYHLVLDRGAVAGTHPLDPPTVHRRAVESGADDRMGPLIGAGDVARRLRGMLGSLPQKREHRHRRIARLAFEFAIVDSTAIDPGRGAGLKATHLERQFT